MKLPALVIALGIGLALGPAFAADTQPSQKGPPKTMGDEGTLPSTSTVGEHVPNMGAQPAEPSTGPSTAKGPQKSMGDEGKLPATGTMSGAVPEMQGGDN